MAHMGFARLEAMEPRPVPPGQAAANRLRAEADELLARRDLTPGSTPPVAGTDRLLADVRRIGGTR